MRLRRALGLSLRALFAHRVRAILALASVSAGVAAVVLTSSIGATASREVDRKITSLGTNLLIVRPAQVKKVATRTNIKGLVTTLRLDDYEAIGQLAAAAEAAPGIEGNMKVKGNAAAMTTKVLGTTPAFPRVRRFRVRQGRFFDDDDDRASRRVVVLGARVADTLFPGDDPVGQQIRVRGATFDIIGVLDAKGVLADGDEDNQVVVPVRTALRRVFNSRSLTTVFVSVKNGRNMEGAAREIGALLRERHRAGDVEIQNAARFFAMQKKTAESLSLLTTGVAAVALLVGGIGILALMFMTVKERTSEIGLRVAVGARPRDILVQFLLEASLLALSGWGVGLLLGGLGIAAIAFSTAWKVGAPVTAIVASLAMALTIGLGFGAFPARKASLIPPIEALLTE
jgi:putative ABC transport system permease protein